MNCPSFSIRLFAIDQRPIVCSINCSFAVRLALSADPFEKRREAGDGGGEGGGDTKTEFNLPTAETELGELAGASNLGKWHTFSDLQK